MGGTSGKARSLSTLGLTCGSLFLLEIHQSLVVYIVQRLARGPYRHLTFELSDSTVKGEGELKILSRLLHQDHLRHLIVGGDSDLLLMALISGQRNLYICEDLQEFAPLYRPGNCIKQPMVFSRDAMEEAWRRPHLIDENAPQVCGMLPGRQLLSGVCSE
jgi:hypothetical protein